MDHKSIEAFLARKGVTLVSIRRNKATWQEIASVTYTFNGKQLRGHYPVADIVGWACEEAVLTAP